MLDTCHIAEANQVISTFKRESFLETLERTLDNLGNRWEETEPEKNRYEYAKYICDLEGSDEFDRALSELTFSFQLCKYDNFEELAPVALDLALICAILSKKEYEQGNSGAAYALINKASYYQGSLDALHAVESEFGHRTSIRRIAQQGGKAKSKNNHAPSQRKAAKLLIEYKPENGWATYSQAIRAISEDILKESKKTKSPLTKDSIEGTLRRWMKGNDIVKHAYEASRHQDKP